MHYLFVRNIIHGTNRCSYLRVYSITLVAFLLILLGCRNPTNRKRSPQISGFHIVNLGNYKSVLRLSDSNHILVTNHSNRILFDFNIVTREAKPLEGFKDSAIVIDARLIEHKIIVATYNGLRVWDEDNFNSDPQVLLNNGEIQEFIESKTKNQIFIIAKDSKGHTELYRLSINSDRSVDITKLDDVGENMNSVKLNMDRTGFVDWLSPETHFRYIDLKTSGKIESIDFSVPILGVYPLSGKTVLIRLSNGKSTWGDFYSGKVIEYNFETKIMTTIVDIGIDDIDISNDEQNLWMSTHSFGLNKDGYGVYLFKKKAATYILDNVFLKGTSVLSLSILGPKQTVWVMTFPEASTSEGIHVFELSGKSISDNCYFKNRKIFNSGINRTGDVGWFIPHEEKGILVANTKLKKGVHVLQDVNFSTVYPDENTDFAWAVSSTNWGLYKISLNGSLFNDGKPVIHNIDREIDDAQIELLRINKQKLVISVWEPYEMPSPYASDAEKKATRNRDVYQHLYLYDEPKKFDWLKIGFADAIFKSGHETPEKISTNLPDGTFTVNYELNIPIDKQNGTVQINVYDEKNKLIATGSAVTTDSIGVIGVKPINENILKLNKLYHISLQYHDAIGSNLKVEWPDTRFTLPIWKMPVVVTTFVWAILTVLFIVLLYLPHNLTGRKWYPILPYLIGGTGINLPFIAEKIHLVQSLFFALVACDLFVFLVTGIISPSVFRRLSNSVGFDWLLKNLLLIPSLRKRIYGDYIIECKRRLVKARHNANDEVYIQLSATFESTSNEKSVVEAPVDFIVSKFITSKSSLITLVKAPGGRGKSALIREVFSKMLNDYETSTFPYLPIFCETLGSSIEDIIKRSMGPFLLSDDVLEWHLALGHVVVICDGFGGSEMASESLVKFLNKNNIVQSRLLISSRTGGEIEEVVRDSGNWLIGEPNRLDDSTVEKFECEYIKHDAQRTNILIKKLSPELKSVCKSTDGTFSPILVRLALIAQESGPVTIDGIYEWSIRQRIRSLIQNQVEEEQLFWGTIEICYDNYWKDQNSKGSRQININVNNVKVLTQVLQCGIVIPIDQGLDSFRNPSRKVRFFHDSIQTYLVARALLSKSNWDALFEAAGNPVFNSDRSDVILENGSELFQMCLLIFPENGLIDFLNTDILYKAEYYSPSLTMNEVLSLIPNNIFIQNLDQLKEMTICNAIINIRDKCRGVGMKLSDLASMYSKFAQVVWAKGLVSDQNTQKKF